LIFLLILKCSAGKNCCVAIVVGSNNMWKAKIKRIKIGFSAKYSAHAQWHLWRQFHTFIRDFAFTHRVFGGKICHVWRRQDDAALLRVIRRAFLFKKCPLILPFNDWLVLEIIIQWTGKTILW
jgi:hypothetical protein